MKGKRNGRSWLADPIAYRLYPVRSGGSKLLGKRSLVRCIGASGSNYGYPAHWRAVRLGSVPIMSNRSGWGRGISIRVGRIVARVGSGS